MTPHVESTNRTYWQNSVTHIKTYVDPYLAINSAKEEISSPLPQNDGGNDGGESIPTSPSTAPAGVKVMYTTINNVMHTIDVILSKSAHLEHFTQAAATAAQSLLSAYVPAVLLYLPERKVGKEYVFLLMLVVLICALFYLGAAHVVVNVTGVLYPAYATIATAENPQKPENKQWLSYWIVYMGLFLTNDTMWVVCQFIPMFPLIKLMFFIWMYHPQSNGASTLYAKAQPYIQKVLHIDLPVGMAAKNALLAKHAGSGTSSPHKETGVQKSHLIVKIVKVTIPTEKNIYVECTVLPKVGRTAEGIEGTCYKTNKILGKTCVFNHYNTFLPLPVLDGILHIDVCEKPTFTEALSLGTTDISLLEFIPGAPAKESTVTLAGTGTDIQVVLGVELVLGEP